MSSSHTAHPVCPICNYDLRGLTQTDDRRLTCTECGTPLQPASPDTLFTKKKVHKLFLTVLVVPTTVPSLSAILLSLLTTADLLNPLQDIVYFFTILYTLAEFLFVPTMLIIATSMAFRRAKPYPRPYNRWVIVLFGLLYTLPAIGCTILMYSAALYFFTF